MKIARVEFKGMDLFDSKRVEHILWNLDVADDLLILDARFRSGYIQLVINKRELFGVWNKSVNVDHRIDQDNIVFVHGLNFTQVAFRFTLARVFVCDVRVNALARSLPADLARVVASFL